MDAPVPVAASQNFEARSSVAYDSQNRLWVAYEASDAKWGKDFGAYETTGVALYQDHTVQREMFPGLAGVRHRGELGGQCCRLARRAKAGREAGKRPMTAARSRPAKKRGQWHRGEFQCGR